MAQINDELKAFVSDPSTLDLIVECLAANQRAKAKHLVEALRDHPEMANREEVRNANRLRRLLSD